MTIRTYQYQIQAVVEPSSGSIVSKSVTTALNLSSVAYVGEQRSAESILAITSQASFQVLPFDGYAVETQLNLQSVARAHGFETVESQLNLQSVATAQIPIKENIHQPLNLVQVATYRVNPINKTVETQLNLTTAASRVHERSVTTALNLTSEAWRSFTPSTELNLVVTAEWGYGYDAESKLEIEGVAEVDKILNQSVTHADIISQAVTYYIESPCAKKQFKQFHGEGGVAPKDKPLNYSNTFHIVSLDDGEIVTLRNPEMDDRRRYAFNRVNRQFFDGTSDIYVDDSWITEQTQLYTIIALKRDDIDTLQTFLLNNLGREVLIKDWKGISWIVIITNPGEVYTEDSEGRWTIDFEVVGEAVDGEYVVSHLNLTDALSRAGSIYTRSATSGNIITSRANRHYDREATSALGLSTEATFEIVGP
jgi:hypothetical protein